MPFFHAFMHSFGILEKKSDKIKLLMRENRRKTLCIWGEKLLKYSNIQIFGKNDTPRAYFLQNTKSNEKNYYF